MLRPATSADLDDLAAFLRSADLTVAALAEPAVHLWLERDEAGAVRATTGFELGAAGEHALVRSVAVRPDLRGAGDGLRLARFALDRAADAGARQAWLFSRRSGGFWQKLGFAATTTSDLAAALPDAHQVRLFRSTGQLDHEVAWHRPLPVRDNVVV
ncbi:GNAT family N-acetyltransferase [Promicromonospora iranensis]|uniref:GNAT family N-acetyltransferase n=1 Tax=Promicromonospora iranensis TaxID=1105144 RepID=UPI0023A94956|nr:GNAT family N-acetyltransferase [Promicromonospora iranensis]